MFNETLSRLRKESEWTQSELAKILHISKTGYANWEQGRTAPGIDELIKLANLFDCSIDYLVGREGEDGIILSGNNLSEAEDLLINTLRQLKPENKRLVYSYVDFLIEQQKK